MVLALALASAYNRLFGSASVTETLDGHLLIQSAPGRFIAWGVAFAVLLPLSLWCWRRHIGGRLAPGFFFASFAIPLIIIPGIATESVRVSPEALIVRTGFWFSPTEFRVSLPEVETIVERHEVVPQRRARREETIWEFHERSGKVRRLQLPDLLEANRGAASEYLRARGIKVEASPPA
jgi:hypothetical protein